jgi:hypothetical protein
MTRPDREGGGPRGDRRPETPATDTRREPAASLTAGGGRGRCWRCGRPFAWTTGDDLAYCAALARAGQAAS